MSCISQIVYFTDQSVRIRLLDQSGLPEKHLDCKIRQYRDFKTHSRGNSNSWSWKLYNYGKRLIKACIRKLFLKKHRKFAKIFIKSSKHRKQYSLQEIWAGKGSDVWALWILWSSMDDMNKGKVWTYSKTIFITP